MCPEQIMSFKNPSLTSAAALGACLLIAPAQAQTTPAPADAEPAKPAEPYTITGNFGIYSQYIFRGLTQTDRKPAFQGGFDFAHTSGFYLGTWGSNVSWLHDSGICHHGCRLVWGML